MRRRDARRRVPTSGRLRSDHHGPLAEFLDDPGELSRERSSRSTRPQAVGLVTPGGVAHGRATGETRFRGRWGLSAQVGSRRRPAIQQWQCYPQIQSAILRTSVDDATTDRSEWFGITVDSKVPSFSSARSRGCVCGREIRESVRGYSRPPNRRVVAS
jgi:hypothetical protein